MRKSPRGTVSLVALAVPGGADLVRLGLELVRPVEVTACRQEQDQPECDEDTQEGVQLRDAGQQQRQDGQRQADAVDREHRLAVAQAEIQQPMMDMRAIRAEWRAPL